jgi:predicted nucleic acid-binding protein
MILVDTAGLFEALDASAQRHLEARQVIESSDDALILSPFVLAELDYFLRERIGQDAQLRLLNEVEGGAYELQLFDTNDVSEARTIVEQHAALRVSLTDASIVVLARKLGANRILTFDGHFRALRPGGTGSYFVLLPEDG